MLKKRPFFGHRYTNPTAPPVQNCQIFRMLSWHPRHFLPLVLFSQQFQLLPCLPLGLLSRRASPAKRPSAWERSPPSPWWCPPPPATPGGVSAGAWPPGTSAWPCRGSVGSRRAAAWCGSCSGSGVPPAIGRPAGRGRSCTGGRCCADADGSWARTPSWRPCRTSRRRKGARRSAASLGDIAGHRLGLCGSHTGRRRTVCLLRGRNKTCFTCPFYDAQLSNL